MEKLKRLFQQYIGKLPDTIIPLSSGSGSNRKYFRLSDSEISLIGVEGTSADENRTFIDLSQHFRVQGLNVPQVFAVSDDNMLYLQEDLGDMSLFGSIENGRKTGEFSEREIELLKQTISYLPEIQFKGTEKLDFSVCYPQEAFDRRTVFWDLNYFKYYFLKISGTEFQENLLENDFEKFANILLQEQANTFLYRDFQSRNVMIHNEVPYFIDFQGGRKGPVHYDVASFLWQAKANFPNELRQELLNVYLQHLKRYLPSIDENIFKEQLKYFILFRTLQVLGAYGFRGYIEKKKHFIESIPFALNNLKDLLQSDFPEIPYLKRLLVELSLKEIYSPLPEGDNLTITVYSFSYKKGIPEDQSGNGGGYVFDCRAIHNPGRYEEYKNLTGFDKPVIDFLEKDGEILVFLDKIYELADKHIERYLERGFTNLMFSFGCTGGQHRSVYCAQRLSEYIADKYKVNVKVIHREQ